MHFEVLVEDASGAIIVDTVLGRILGPNDQEHTYRVHAYKGVGRLPRDLRGKTDPQKRILLDRLPRLLKGYAQSLRGGDAAVIVVVDQDDRDCLQFKHELVSLLNRCAPDLRALIRIAIEESEAWLLGDKEAVSKAYPRAEEKVLRAYVQDSVCGTWECLADAVYPGGSARLVKLGWPHTGNAKCDWAKKIAPHLDLETNESRSFQVFRDGIRRLAAARSS